MKTVKIPTYGLHKATGQARCYVDGKTIYLGKYDSEESRVRFGQLIAQLAGGPPVTAAHRCSVVSGGAADMSPATAQKSKECCDLVANIHRQLAKQVVQPGFNGLNQTGEVANAGQPFGRYA